MAIRTFLRAKNLLEAIRQGITPVTDSLPASVEQKISYALYERTDHQPELRQMAGVAAWPNGAYVLRNYPDRRCFILS